MTEIENNSKRVDCSDFIMTLCQSVANVITSATSQETRYAPLVQ